MKLLYILFFLFSFYACSENPSDRKLVPEGENYPVRLQITTSGMGAVGGGNSTRGTTDGADALQVDWTADAATRATADELTEAEQKIHKVWLLQFNGNVPASKLAKAPEELTIERGSASCTLTGYDTTCRIYVIANVDEATVNSFTTATTLATFEATVFPITNGYMTPEQVTEKGLPFCAVQELNTQTNAPKAFELQSRMAKLTLSYTPVDKSMFDQTSDPPVEVSVSMANLPNGFVFRPLPTEEELAAKQHPAGITYTDSLMLDASGGDASVSAVTVYVAENLGGQNTTVTSKTARSRTNAPTNSLHMKIAVKETKKTGHDPIINEDILTITTYGYSIYLGDLVKNPGDFNVEGNHAYTVRAAVTGKNEDDLRLSVDVDNTGYQNLGLDGTANCYIIPKVTPGTAIGYYIDATVMGEGVSNSGFTAATLAPVSAKVVWETRNTTSMTEGSFIDNSTAANKKVRIINSGGKQYLAFHVMNYGNAVIAVYGSGDATGDALWSWHIWAPEDKPVGIGLKGISGTLSANDDDITLLDMYLGALKKSSVDAVSCMLYQWGRKDPFPGCGTPIINNAPIMALSGSTTVAADGSIAKSIANPETFYASLSASNDWNGTTPSSNLWGTPTGAIVTIRGKQYYNVKGEKTIYDPCPNGWRVPPAYTFANVTTTAWNSTYQAHNLKYITTGTEDFWFSACGNRSTAGMQVGVGTVGVCWTSADSPSISNYGSSLYYSLSKIVLANINGHSFGLAVRCAQVK